MSLRKRTLYENKIVSKALAITEAALQKTYEQISGPDETDRFVLLKLSAAKEEQVLILYLNNQHALIESRVEFKGTINSCMIYPRVIAQSALELNAAAIIWAHNHPSGSDKPSRADRNLSQRLKDTMDLIEVRVLDNLIVAGNKVIHY